MKKPDERGVSAVEFALLLPVLVLILFCILEGGLMLYNQQVITNASREGARAGILMANPRPTQTNVISVVEDYTRDRLVSFEAGANTTTITTCFNSNGISYGDHCPANIPVTCPDVPADCPLLRVDVTYPYHFLVLDNLGFNLDPLRAQTTMRCEM
ncbi:MAG: pilus assembly protein [Smithella sp.]|jgi:Flp pilus assembly protein TadG